MNLRDGLLTKTKESESYKIPKVSKELESLVDLIIKKTTKDAENGLYTSELVLFDTNFPEINYIYLNVLGLTDYKAGLTKLKYVLIHLLDISLTIDVFLDDNDQIVVSISWGYDIHIAIKNHLKIKDDYEMQDY